MQDLTQYSDNEFSLQVFNDEYLYIERLNRPYLMALINEEFEYSKEQMSVLIDGLDSDLEEIEIQDEKDSLELEEILKQYGVK